MMEENEKQTSIIREVKKVFKRKIPGFREKLSVDDIRKNPFIIVMIQTALSKGEISPEENFIIRKVTRAIFSFVSGKLIDEILPKAIEKEQQTPTSLFEIIALLKNKAKENQDISEYDHKIHLLTFAYIVAFEDGYLTMKEAFIKKLIEKLSLSKKEVSKVLKNVKENYIPGGQKRSGNIFRNIVKPSTETPEEYKGSKLKALANMFNFIRDYKWLYIFSLIALAIMSLIQIVNPLIIRHIIDNVFVEKDYNVFLILLISFSLFAFGLRFVSVISRFISGLTGTKAIESATRDLKDKIYRHLVHLPFSFYDKNKTGELISICTSDINSVSKTFLNINSQFVRIVVSFLGAFISMIMMNWQLALLSICTFPIVMLISVFFFRKESSTYKGYQEQEARLSAVLQENLTGVRVVKAFARQQFEEEKFEKENSLKYKIGRTLMKIHAIFWPTTDIIGILQICIAIIVGSMMTLDGVITLGTMIAFVQFLFMIVWPMKMLGRMIVELGKASVSWKRLNYYILDKETEETHIGISHNNTKMNGEIEFRNVNFEYEKDLPIIKNFNLKIETGEKVALIGATGCGKSTIINLLGGFYPLTSGEIYIDGVNIQEYSREYLNSQIGFIHQEAFLFSKSIKDNIAFAKPDIEEEFVIRAAKYADIDESIQNFPQKYETIVGEKGVTLSGGQKQRVTIARTILKDPAILILDDSLSAVDTETEANILNAMDRIMQGRTSIIIAHRITTIMKADKIIVLKDGEIIQQGTHEELIEVDGLYKSIFNIQVKIEEEIEKEVANV